MVHFKVHFKYKEEKMNKLMFWAGVILLAATILAVPYMKLKVAEATHGLPVSPPTAEELAQAE